ncbi:tRNA N6-adenosine threonylcarbamoyltransferase, mitochondrial [Streptomyces sp. enrichment culture]
MAPGVESSYDKQEAVLVRDPITHLGGALDDAVAECFDKDASVIEAVTACAEHGVSTLLAAGGITASSPVRSPAEEHRMTAGAELPMPPLRLCTGNGAMTAPVGGLLVRAGAAPAPLEYTAQGAVVMGKAVAA